MPLQNSAKHTPTNSRKPKRKKPAASHEGQRRVYFCLRPKLPPVRNLERNHNHNPNRQRRGLGYFCVKCSTKRVTGSTLPRNTLDATIDTTNR